MFWVWKKCQIICFFVRQIRVVPILLPSRKFSPNPSLKLYKIQWNCLLPGKQKRDFLCPAPHGHCWTSVTNSGQLFFEGRWHQIADFGTAIVSTTVSEPRVQMPYTPCGLSSDGLLRGESFSFFSCAQNLTFFQFGDFLLSRTRPCEEKARIGCFQVTSAFNVQHASSLNVEI